MECTISRFEPHGLDSRLEASEGEPGAVGRSLDDLGWGVVEMGMNHQQSLLAIATVSAHRPTLTCQYRPYSSQCAKQEVAQPESLKPGCPPIL